MIRLRLRPSVTLALAFPADYDHAALVPLLDSAPGYVLELAGGWAALVVGIEHVPRRLATGPELCDTYDSTGSYATAARATGVHKATVWRAVKARQASREREQCASFEYSRRRRAG